MYISDDEYREIIFNQWFDKQTNKYETMKEGKFCDIGIVIKYAPFINTFNKVYRSNMRYYDTRQDCYSDCIGAVWEGLLNFKIKDESSWEEIAEKRDVDNYKKLVSFLKKHIVKNIAKINQECAETSRLIGKKHNRKVLHIYYNISPDTLNQITTFDNSLEKIELMDTVTESYWCKKYEYKYDIFSEWVRNNLDNILTESQKKLINFLKNTNYSTFDNECYSDKEEVSKAKFLSDNVGNAKLKLDRIREKVTAKYCNDQKYFTGGYVIQNIDAEVKALKKFTNILENEDIKLDDLDKSLTKVVLKSMNNPHWERLLYEDITEESLLDIIRVYNSDTVIYENNFKLFNHHTGIKRKTLYELSNVIHNQLEFLNKMRKYELEILEKESIKKKVNKDVMRYTLPDKGSTIYLNVTPDGLMIQK